MLTWQVSSNRTRWRWFSPTWLLPPSFIINNPKQNPKHHRQSRSLPELYRPLKSAASLPRTRKKARLLHDTWLVFSFLSANAELLTWPASVLCNSATRTRIILFEKMKGWKKEELRDVIYLSSHSCDDWQPASEVLSFTPILRQTEHQQLHGNAVDWSYFLRESII